MTAEHMASCQQNKKPCAPEQQKQDSPHRDRDKQTPSMDWSRVDYCDVFRNCLHFHSDDIYSLQRASDVMLNFSKLLFFF